MVLEPATPSQPCRAPQVQFLRLSSGKISHLRVPKPQWEREQMAELAAGGCSLAGASPTTPDDAQEELRRSSRRVGPVQPSDFGESITTVHDRSRGPQVSSGLGFPCPHVAPSLYPGSLQCRPAAASSRWSWSPHPRETPPKASDCLQDKAARAWGCEGLSPRGPCRHVSQPAQITLGGPPDWAGAGLMCALARHTAGTQCLWREQMTVYRLTPWSTSGPFLGAWGHSTSDEATTAAQWCEVGRRGRGVPLPASRSSQGTQLH